MPPLYLERKEGRGHIQQIMSEIVDIRPNTGKTDLIREKIDPNEFCSIMGAGLKSSDEEEKWKRFLLLLHPPESHFQSFAEIE